MHRDLKPSNIVYDGHKRWKILDLGLAKALGDRQSLTRPGVILGTLDYAAPEQLRDASKVESPADYYALGCILYHALAGHVPFDGGDAVSKIYRHRMTPPEPLSIIRPELPADLCQLVEQLLAKNPQDRPHFDVVAGRLDRLMAGRSTPTADEFPNMQDQGSFLGQLIDTKESESKTGGDSESNPEDPTEEELPDVSEDDWSAPLDDDQPRSRLVINQSRFKPAKRTNSAELSWILSVMLFFLLITSLFLFIRSLNQFVRLFL